MNIYKHKGLLVSKMRKCVEIASPIFENHGNCSPLGMRVCRRQKPVWELHSPPPPPRRGHFHTCAYWVCATWETTSFSPKFPLQSIIMFTNKTHTQKKRSEASPFYSFDAPETIIFKISLPSRRSVASLWRSYVSFDAQCTSIMCFPAHGTP